MTKDIIDAPIQITSYNSTSKLYTFPKDGYVSCYAGGGGASKAYVCGSGGNTSYRVAMINGENETTKSLYVRKGMKCYCTCTNTSQVNFYGLS